MTPSLYGLLALGIVAAGSAGWAWIQTERLETAKAQLSTCRDNVARLDSALQKQNKAITDLETASKTAQEASRKAKARSEVENKGLSVEVARLRLEAKKGGKSACPAGDAVRQIRMGLK